jgi:glutamate synthase domain-containing protein 2
MNTGEGGLSSYHLEGGCDIVYQIGTAKYGIRSKDGKLCDEKLRAIAKYPQVKMFEIKMSQGAKPGKGGILPAAKVTEEIAKIRGIDAGQDSISPNGHEDIKSVDDLLDMINHIRDITGKPVGFKIVVGQVEFFHDLFKAIHQRGLNSAPDFITLDSADGGTGAAPSCQNYSKWRKFQVTRGDISPAGYKSSVYQLYHVGIEYGWFTPGKVRDSARQGRAS